MKMINRLFESQDIYKNSVFELSKNHIELRFFKEMYFIITFIHAIFNLFKIQKFNILNAKK
jgi:hypothetical protein